MGRALKRVVLDFDWPQSKPWKGYINPHHKKCPEHNRTCFQGYTAASRWLDAISRFLSLMAEECFVTAEERKRIRARGGISPHPYMEEFPQAPTRDLEAQDQATLDAMLDKEASTQERMRFLTRAREKQKAEGALMMPLTPELGRLLYGFVGKTEEPDGRGFPWGGNDNYKLYQAIKKAAGIPEDDKSWGRCPVCLGEGIDPSVREAYDAWEEYEPPAGEGWQMWETVSEGSPITPVFPTAELLVWYLTEPNGFAATKWGRGHPYSKEAAESFVYGDGWAPSAMLVDGKVYSDLESLTIPHPDKNS